MRPTLIAMAVLGCATQSAPAAFTPAGERVQPPPINRPAAPGEYGYGWRAPPGPIVGRWQARCDQMVVEVRLLAPTKAAGFVYAVDDASGRGYQSGEEILHLAADEYGGDWFGELKWRGANGVERWEPIRFVSKQDLLDAVMTTDDCYRGMSRVK